MAVLGHNALFQERLLSHAKAPRHAGRLDGAAASGAQIVSAHAVNSLCGDELWLDVELSHGHELLRGGFESKGCALCRASASIMLAALEGATTDTALALGARVRCAFAGEIFDKTWPGDLAALMDVRGYPSRSRCVLLAWDALNDVLKDALKLG